MEIWLDTIDYASIEEGAKTGIIAGITTNPSILSQSINIRETLNTLLKLQDGPIAVQVISKDAEGMIEEGMRLFEFSSRLIVKVPINRNGLIAIKRLIHEKIPVLGTSIIFPTQALLASTLGASYIAPYYSHMEATGDGAAALKTMKDILNANASSTKILAASLKKIEDLIYCATLGVAAVTIKPALFNTLIENQPLVEGFLKNFLTDWTKTHGQLSLKKVLPKN